MDKPDPRPPRCHVCRLVGEHVLRLIGHPAGFKRVEARLLWESDGLVRLRVNVRVDATKRGDRIESTKISHSFFVVAGNAQELMRVDPPLRRVA